MKVTRRDADRLKGRRPSAPAAPAPAPDADALARALLRQMREKPATSPYKIELVRGENGRVTSVMAKPVGDGEAFRFDVARTDGEIATITAQPIEDDNA